MLQGSKMEAFKYALLKIINGERKLNERRKYVITGILLSLVHLYFMCLFLVLDVRIMYLYNFGAVLIYTGIAVITGRVAKYTYIFIVTFIEILFHSVLASLVLGWDWGFMTYTLGLIPTSFYIAYTVDYFKKKLRIPAIASAIVLICFLLVGEITSHNGPLYGRFFSDRAVHATYLFNMMLTFALLWGIAFLFSLEVYYMQHNLENENISLEQLANYDPLTHLLNRRSMDSYLEESFYRARKKRDRFSIIMADIDDFKKINDTYGHAAGDAVLIEVASVVSGEVRDEDYVCRWGGEEIVILVKSGMDQAKSVAWRICKGVAAREIPIGDETLKVSMTLGVAEYRDGESVNEVVERADKRMYEGKIRGKNRVVCDRYIQ